MTQRDPNCYSHQKGWRLNHPPLSLYLLTELATQPPTASLGSNTLPYDQPSLLRQNLIRANHKTEAECQPMILTPIDLSIVVELNRLAKEIGTSNSFNQQCQSIVKEKPLQSSHILY